MTLIIALSQSEAVQRLSSAAPTDLCIFNVGKRRLTCTNLWACRRRAQVY